MSVMASSSKNPEEKPARRAARELMSEEFLDDLMSRVDEGGLALTGEDGFLPELVKAVLEHGSSPSTAPRPTPGCLCNQSPCRCTRMTHPAVLAAGKTIQNQCVLLRQRVSRIQWRQ